MLSSAQVLALIKPHRYQSQTWIIRHLEGQRLHASCNRVTSSHTTSWGAWRIHHLTFPSLCSSVSHCWMSKFDSKSFPMGNCSRISFFFSHPLVPIVCSAAVELAANQSQRFLSINKLGIVASPRAGTEQSNQQFSQVMAAWSISQGSSWTLLHALPGEPFSMQHARQTGALCPWKTMGNEMYAIMCT